MRIPFKAMGLPVLVLSLLVSGCGDKGSGGVGGAAAESFSNYRNESQKNACISNMKQIQAAVEMALLKGNEKPTLESLCGPDKLIKVEPKCPAGGSYSIKYTGNDYTITCPHADKGHVLPQ